MKQRTRTSLERLEAHGTWGRVAAILIPVVVAAAAMLLLIWGRIELLKIIAAP